VFIPKYRRSILDKYKEGLKEIFYQIAEKWGENRTSSVCPFCGTKGRRITRGLFYCPRCEQVMNADIVGCLNIAKKCKAIIPNPSWRGRDNGVLTHPAILLNGGLQTSPLGILAL